MQRGADLDQPDVGVEGEGGEAAATVGGAAKVKVGKA